MVIINIDNKYINYNKNMDTFNIQGEVFTTSQLMEMIQFYRIHHHNYLDNQDIINVIMIHSDICDTNALLRQLKKRRKQMITFG